MIRNPKLAEQAGEVAGIKELRGSAVDKITAASIGSNLLNREGVSPERMLANEERLLWLFEDATYAFQRYVHEKLKAYEALLIEVSPVSQALTPDYQPKERQ